MSEGIKIGGLNTEHVKTNPDGKTEGFTIGKDRVDAKDNIFYSVSRTNHNETFQRFVDYEEVDILVNDIYNAAGEDEILTEEEQRELFVKWWTQDINDEGVKPGDRGYIQPNKAEDYTDELFKKHKKQFEEVLSDKKKFAFDIESARVSDEEMMAILDEQADKVENEIEQLDISAASEADVAQIVALGIQEAQEAIQQTEEANKEAEEIPEQAQDPWGQEQVVDVKKEDLVKAQSEWMNQYNSKTAEELTQDKLTKLNELSANVQDEQLASLIDSAVNSKSQKAYTEAVKQIKTYVNKNYKDLPEGLARNTKGGSGTILNFVQTDLTDANGRALFVAPMEASSSYGHMAFAYPDVDDKVALKAFVEANSYEGGPFEAGKDYDFNAVANIMAKNKGKNFFYPDLSTPSEDQKQKVAEYKDMQELMGVLDSLKLKDIQAHEEKIAEAKAEIKAEVQEAIAEERKASVPAEDFASREIKQETSQTSPASEVVDRSSLLLSDRTIEVNEEFLADITDAATAGATAGAMLGGLLSGANTNANIENVLADIEALSSEEQVEEEAVTGEKKTEEVSEVKATEQVSEEQAQISEENSNEAAFDLSSMSAQERSWYEYYLNNLAPNSTNSKYDLPSINEVREATLKDIETKLGVTYADGKVEIKNPELIDNPQLRMFYEIINQR